MACNNIRNPTGPLLRVSIFGLCARPTYHHRPRIRVFNSNSAVSKNWSAFPLRGIMFQGPSMP